MGKIKNPRGTSPKFTLTPPSFLSDLCFWVFLLQGLTWATIGAWTKNLPKNVFTCPGHQPQLIARNIVIKIFRGEPPPL